MLWIILKTSAVGTASQNLQIRGRVQLRPYGANLDRVHACGGPSRGGGTVRH